MDKKLAKNYSLQVKQSTQDLIKNILQNPAKEKPNYYIAS